MTSTSQFFLQIGASVLISVVVWVTAAITILSLWGIVSGGGLATNASFSESASYGLAVGLLHGFLTGAVIYWQRAESLIGFTISSIAATEILIIFGGVAWFLYRYFNPVIGGTPAPPAPFFRYFLYIYALLIWFGVLSSVLLLPSIIAGATNRFISLFDLKFS